MPIEADEISRIAVKHGYFFAYKDFGKDGEEFKRQDMGEGEDGSEARDYVPDNLDAGKMNNFGMNKRKEENKNKNNLEIGSQRSSKSRISRGSSMSRLSNAGKKMSELDQMKYRDVQEELKLVENEYSEVVKKITNPNVNYEELLDQDDDIDQEDENGINGQDENFAPENSEDILGKIVGEYVSPWNRLNINQDENNPDKKMKFDEMWGSMVRYLHLNICPFKKSAKGGQIMYEHLEEAMRLLNYT